MGADRVCTHLCARNLKFKLNFRYQPTAVLENGVPIHTLWGFVSSMVYVSCHFAIFFSPCRARTRKAATVQRSGRETWTPVSFFSFFSTSFAFPKQSARNPRRSDIFMGFGPCLGPAARKSWLRPGCPSSPNPKRVVEPLPPKRIV